MVAGIFEDKSKWKKGVVIYGYDGTDLVPLKINADGELVVNLEAATVNIGDVDVASIAAGANLIGKVGIDQSTANANEVVVKTSALPTGAATAANQGDSYRDIGSPVRITHNSTSQSVAVPANAKAFVCMAEGGATRCEIDGAASATSAVYVAEEASLFYPISGGSQTLYAYGTAGYGNFRFLG